MPWDPALYLTYGSERSRPFLDLVSRIDAAGPASVVDLGCGTGSLTALLKQRWPDADVLGIDSSPEMVAEADVEGVRFEVGSIESWDGSADVVVSNAAYQWVPGHLALLPSIAERAREWFAFQVPGNHEAPTHTFARALGKDPRFAPYVEGVGHPFAHDPATYLEALTAAGWEVDAWETTYLHVLQGDDAVFTWVSATGVRPALEALPDGLREEFATELKAMLNEAYPRSAAGTVMPFRRIFVVARR